MPEGKKLVIIGGSSLNTPWFFTAMAEHNLKLGQIYLVGRNKQKLETVGNYCHSLSKKLKLSAEVSWTTKLDEALTGTHYILNQLRAGGTQGQVTDRKNLALSGITGHAAGYVEAIHNLPPILDAVKTMEEKKSSAIFINFTNPVSIICEAIAMNSSINFIGICHHTLSLNEKFAQLLQSSPEETCIDYFGINHLGWISDVKINGKSQMQKAVNIIKKHKIKEFNYQYAGEFGTIPTHQAYCLYRKGESVYIRGKGIRGSVEDVKFKYLTHQIHTVRLKKQRAKILEEYRKGNLEHTVTRKPSVTYYQDIIVPFLKSLDSEGKKFIATTRQKENPYLTAETTVKINRENIKADPVPENYPKFALEMLDLVKASEKMFIQAIIEKSYEKAVEAMFLHPNVLSLKHAEKLLSKYFN
ncbi:hypothetical protein GF312_11090 [Candidatus Poribacteria bacterium]|nr:hypothetical protein [Candidatus Poribacteria bacterium]